MTTPGRSQGVSGQAATRPSRLDDVVEAAVELFGKSGIEHVTMEDIAAESGLVARAIYYHFATKDDLVHAAFSRVRDEVDAIVAAAQDLDTAVRNTFTWGSTHPWRARLLWVHSVGATPEMSALWEQFIAAHVDASRRYREVSASAHDRTLDSVDWLAARTAVIAGTEIQLCWGTGELPRSWSSGSVAEAVAGMFRALIAD